MSTDLIPLENPKPAELFAPGGLDSILSRIESEAKALVPDVTTAKGRKEIASLAAKVAKAKTYLDALGKDYTEDMKRTTKAVDEVRRAMRDRLDALKEQVRRPLTDWEQAETDRVDAIRARMVGLIREATPGLPSATYAAAIAELEAVDVDESFAEFRADAQSAKEGSPYRLTVARDVAIRREAEAARLAAEAEAARAKAQQEREEHIAREAAERATREARERAERERQAHAEAMELERLAREAAEARAREAERDRLAAIERERQRQIQAEAARVAEEAARRADEDNRERVHAEIAGDLVAATDWLECDLMEIVDAIAAGKIRHLHITY